MNRPVATRILENLNKYNPVVQLLGEKHQEFSGTIDLVKLAVNGLAKYYGLFILDQHAKLIKAARIEDDYSRNVTLIGRDVKTWLRNPDVTLRGKIGLTRLYGLLERCLRDALELYTESERELIREDIKVYMSVSDAHGEYERAQAALWRFQHDFHLHQIDLQRGSDRAIIYNQSPFAAPPVGFNNPGFSRPVWQEPDEERLRVLTAEEQSQLKSFLSRPDVQRLLPSDLRNPNVNLPPVEDDDSDESVAPGPSKIGPLVIPKPGYYVKKMNGILKDPGSEAPRDKSKKTVRFGPYVEPPLPSHDVHDDSLLSIHSIELPEIIIQAPSTPSRHSSPTSSDNPTPPQTPPPTPADRVTKKASVSNDMEETKTFAPPSSEDSSSSSSSSSLPSVSLSPTASSESATLSNSSEDGHTTESSTTTGSDKSEGTTRVRTPGNIRREVAMSVRAYLGRRHDEYGLALAVDPDTDFGEDQTEGEYQSQDQSQDQSQSQSQSQDEDQDEERNRDQERDQDQGEDEDEYDTEYLSSSDGDLSYDDEDMPQAADNLPHDNEDLPYDDEYPPQDAENLPQDAENLPQDAENLPHMDEDLPYDDEAWAAHYQLSHEVHQKTTHDVTGTALLHWAGVTKAKREERVAGHTRLRRILKWAERNGKIPLSPSSIRASTGLRRGIFTPLGPPDLPQPPRTRRERRRRVCGSEAYRDAVLADLEDLAPRTDLTLLAFLANQDALRLFGGLVGERPFPRDLAWMDKEVYTAVCAHRRRIIVSYLKRTRRFPTALAPQFGDLRAARQDAEEAKLSAARRCFEHVAERSRRVMTYPGGKRRRREFGGRLGARDRERLWYLSNEDDEAAALRAELEGAEGWEAWCEGVMGEWALGRIPGRVEKDMLYVDEETLADVRRYQLEINQKRDSMGLVPVKRPQDEVYERQQEHIQLLDILWNLLS